ncbi:hypothetical protein GWI33_021958 [Rhynchophorus ferrugineus]|uniref:Uncharacterized protein n=1 Tax=Rhynchophorus ferrugineus TaxID=354439 RepID=A0A834MI56_RHYFE|nr:hypothetical protein GWI33_021958 [Rhynchophorus ferrugineus]
MLSHRTGPFSFVILSGNHQTSDLLSLGKLKQKEHKQRRSRAIWKENTEKADTIRMAAARVGPRGIGNSLQSSLTPRPCATRETASNLKELRHQDGGGEVASGGAISTVSKLVQELRRGN